MNIYGLGAILYELLTGRPPFQGTTPLETIVQAAHEPVVPPRNLRPEIPRNLETICLKCLEREPASRYQIGRRAGRRPRALPRRPADPGPSGRRGRAARQVGRRRPAGAALVSLGVAAILAGATGSAFHFASMRTAVKDLEAEQKKTKAALDAETRAKRRVREALNALTGDVVEKLLVRRPKLSADERNFLNRVRGFYDDFGREPPRPVEDRAVRAEGFLRVGAILQKIDESKDAEAAFRASIEEYERLCASPTAAIKYRQALLGAIGRLADLYSASRRWDDERRTLLRLERERGEAANPQQQFDVADWHYKLGLNAKERLRWPEAESSFRRSLELFDRLDAEHPGFTSARGHVLGVSYSIGMVLLKQGRLDESESSFREMAARAERLERDLPGDPAGPRGRSHALEQLIALQQTRGRFEDADLLQRDRLAMLAKIAETNPSSTKAQLDLIFGLWNTRANSIGLGRPAEAIPFLREAATRVERLTDEYPTVFDHANLLAQINIDLGRWLTRYGRTEDAPPCFDRAIVSLAPWLSHPEHSGDCRWVTGLAQVGAAEALLRLGRPAEAAQRCEAALALTPAAGRPALQLQLAQARWELRELDAAERAIEGALADKPDGALLIQSAEILALLATAESPRASADRRANQAVALLRRARDAGVFADAAALKAQTANDNFRALRDRHDYQALIDNSPPPKEEAH